MDTVNPAAATSATTFTVTQALGLANRAVLEAAPDELWVVGTVAGLVRSRPGHLYFQLADHDADGSTPSAVLPVVAFARDSVGINRTLAEAGVELANGLAIRLRGRLSIYPPKATVQLIASAVDPAVTVGEGTLRKRDLLAALERERLLVRQRQLPMPTAPFHVGVVGPPGAGTADVLSVLRDSGLGFRWSASRLPHPGPGHPARSPLPSPGLAASGSTSSFSRGAAARPAIWQRSTASRSPGRSASAPRRS